MTLMSSSSSFSSFLSVRRHGFSPSRVLYLEKRCFCEEDDCFNINEKIAKAKACVCVCVCVYIYITKVLYDEVRFARVHARAYCFSFCSSSECTFPNGIPFTLGSTYSAAISFTSGKKSSS